MQSLESSTPATPITHNNLPHLTCPRHPTTQRHTHTRHTTPSPYPHIPPPRNTHNTNSIDTIKINTPIPYTHPAITALTLNTMGMHTTIIDLQALLHTQTKPTIIALTETKHKHNKSIWRHIL